MQRIEPWLKKMIKDSLESKMYETTNRRQQEKLREIIRTNTIDSQYTHQSFSYRGEFYNLETTVPRYKNQRLLPELRESMDEWLETKKKLDFDEVPYVTGFFNRVLNASNSVLDYRAILPEWLHPVLDALPIPENLVLPRELTDEQVEQFKVINAQGLLVIKKRMVLDLVTV